MEGVYFYWFSWMLWVMYTFFMRKNKIRFVAAVSLLMVIILSPYDIDIGSFRITYSYIFLTIFTYYFVSRRRRWPLYYMFIASLILTLAFVSYHLFSLFDPIWLFMDRTWLLALIMAGLSIVLYTDHYSRLLLLISAMCQGDLLYAVIINRYAFPHTVGSLAFLDALMASCSLLFLWYFMENVAVFIDEFRQKFARETKQS